MKTIREDVNWFGMCCALYRNAERRGLSSAEIKAHMKLAFNIDSMKDLTLDEYKVLRKHINAIPRKMDVYHG